MLCVCVCVCVCVFWEEVFEREKIKITTRKIFTGNEFCFEAVNGLLTVVCVYLILVILLFPVGVCFVRLVSVAFATFDICYICYSSRPITIPYHAKERHRFFSVFRLFVSGAQSFTRLNFLIIDSAKISVFAPSQIKL